MREPQPLYALFRHSMGALISFELARELRRRRFAAPRQLFLSGRAWEEHTSASCNLRLFTGDHFFIHSPGIGFVDVFRRDVLSTLHHPEQAV